MTILKVYNKCCPVTLMFEVEARGRLLCSIDEMSDKLKSLGADFIEKRKRLSLIYFKVHFGETSGDNPDKVTDLRIRVNNGKSEIVLKYGKPGPFDNRKEVSIPIRTKNFADAVMLLKILGWDKGVITVTNSYKFIFKSIEFVLVDAGLKDECYFEAERLSETLEDIQTERDYITKVCSELTLTIFKESDYYQLIDKINSLPGRKFNFNNEDFGTIKDRFLEYFESKDCDVQ